MGSSPSVIKDVELNVCFNKILLNNLKVILLLVLGSITFGASTFTNLIMNGFYFGAMMAFAEDSLIVVLLVIPHGIFEIPAIIIAGAAGFKIPYEIVRYLAGKKEQILTKEDFKEYLTLALISIILIAAWIEANVTLKIAKAMLNSSKGVLKVEQFIFSPLRSFLLKTPQELC